MPKGLIASLIAAAFVVFAALFFVAPAGAHQECHKGAYSTICAEVPDTTPDPCANGGCDAISYPPSALAQNTAKYRDTLNALAQFFDTNRFAAAGDPASDQDLSGRLDDLYATGYRAYLNLSQELASAMNRARGLEQTNSELKTSITLVTDSIAKLRQANAETETKARAAEVWLHKLETQAQQLQSLALALINDHRSDIALISYVEVYGRDPNYKRTELDHLQTRSLLDGFSTAARTAPPRLPNAGPTAASAGPAAVMPPSEMHYLAPEASADEKFQKLDELGRSLRSASDQRRTYDGQIARLKPENDRLSAQNQTLMREIDSLAAAARALDDRRAIAETYAPVEAQNRKVAAVALTREMVVSFAKEKALDKMKDSIDKLVGVSGITSAIPTNAQDLVMKAAREGRRILIPQYGFKAQWDAFMKVQVQTSTILDRSQGYIKEAARLCAEGSPGELEHHIAKVFGSVKWEAADYARTVGTSDLGEADTGVIQKAFDKFLDAKKAQEEGR